MNARVRWALVVRVERLNRSSSSTYAFAIAAAVFGSRSSTSIAIVPSSPILNGRGSPARGPPSPDPDVVASTRSNRSDEPVGDGTAL